VRNQINIENLTVAEISKLLISLVRRGVNNDTVEKLIETLAMRAEKCERN
jgi:hypothetical protein